MASVNAGPYGPAFLCSGSLCVVPPGFLRGVPAGAGTCLISGWASMPMRGTRNQSISVSLDVELSLAALAAHALDARDGLLAALLLAATIDVCKRAAPAIGKL